MEEMVARVVELPINHAVKMDTLGTHAAKERTISILRHFCLAALMLIVAPVSASAAKPPRYIFQLPEGYIGWIQVIFNDPNAPPLSVKNGGVVIKVPDTGVVRTSDIRVHSSLAHDEFYFRSAKSDASAKDSSVPADYVLPGTDHGGFGVMDTGGKGKGYSWFIFIGPPTVRSGIPLGDWNTVVQEWKKAHKNMRIPAPDPYPAPGRMTR